jgi:pimeloyl-ACP methyl ester carboxylesterase
MASRKLLITIHGINSDRKWQNSVVGVLSRHFTCELLRYDGYRRFGLLRNCFSLRLFPLLAAGVAIAVYWRVNVGGALVFLSIVASFWLAIKKRARTVDRFLRDYDDVTARHKDRSPHVIAHSFGTYLLCRGLDKYPDCLTFDRAILWGSVVDSEFEWDAVAARAGISSVRNERSRGDYVSFLAGYAFWIKGLGNSGYQGFKRPAGIVDNVLERFRHSDAGKLRKRVQETWLPFLWGIAPDEYVKLLNACASCLDSLPPGSVNSKDPAIGNFELQRWSWATIHGEAIPFKEFMQTSLHDLCTERRTNSFVKSAGFDACYLIARNLFWRNCKEQENHPRWVVAEAVEEAFGYLFARP